MVQSETFYELWEETQPVFSPHSRLYHLEPIGVGSPMVESLTSYVTRLAEAHCVHPLTLLAKEILPVWNLPSVYQDGNLVYSHLTAFWKDSASLNGTSSMAQGLIQALKELTQSHDLHRLTMQPFKEVLSPRNLIRRTRSWCACCYEEWRESGHIVYEPLLWSLTDVSICPVHRCVLASCCPNPDCHRVQYPLAPQSQSGYCAWCGRWLGQLSDLVAPSLLLEDRQWAWMHWVGAQVGKLLAANGSPLPRATIAQALTVYLNEGKSRWGRKSALARKLYVTAQAVDGWLSGRQIPQLLTLMQICAYLEISPLWFLTQIDAGVKTGSASDQPVKPIIEKSMRSFRRMDIAGLQNALEEILHGTEDPPPCTEEVAQRLGYGSAHLWKVFPEPCKAISAKYRDYHAKKRERRLQALVSKVRQVMYSLHAQGYYPSAWLVEKKFQAGGIFREPVVLTTWRETLLELGLRQ